MMLSFLADVDEDHILNGKYEGNEEDRIHAAIELLEQSPLYIEMMPDFSLQDIENTIIICRCTNSSNCITGGEVEVR